MVCCCWLSNFKNGLGHLKEKRGGGGGGGGVGGGVVWGGEFVLRGANPFLKSDRIVMCQISHG